MSREISSASRSPVKKFVEYKGKDGVFEYYDKEQKERVRLQLPLRFIVLNDKRITVTGYNDASGSGIYANEVDHISKPLKVKTFKGGPIAEGPWEKIKDKVTSKGVGGRFCKVVYGALKVEPTEENPDGFEYIAFKFDGASIGPWFDLQGSANLLTHGVEICDEFVEGKKGNNKFKIPVFRAVKLGEKHIAIADKMYEPLREYFKGYDNKGLEEAEAETSLPRETFEGAEKTDFNVQDASELFGDDANDDFAQPKKPEPAERTVGTEEGIRSKSIDSDDLPF